MTVKRGAPHGRDGAQYIRAQQGHSIVKHIFLRLVAIGFFTIPYYTISKDNYWHI